MSSRVIASRCKDPNVDGAPVLAVQDRQGDRDVSPTTELEDLAAQVFGTTDRAIIPACVNSLAQGRTADFRARCEVLNYSYFEIDFPDTFRTAVEIRNEIAERGWQQASSRSRRAIRCTARTRNCAAWRWSASAPTVSSSTCCSAN